MPTSYNIFQFVGSSGNLIIFIIISLKIVLAAHNPLTEIDLSAEQW